MANNLFANTPAFAVARQTVSFAAAGFDETNVSIIFEAGNPFKSWKPTRTTNSITGFTEGVGYMIRPLVSMDKETYLIPPIPAGGGGGGTYDSSAQAFFDATGETDPTIMDAVDALVVGIKGITAGNATWNKLHLLYPFVGGTALKHSFNLKNPAAYQITWQGTVAHTANGMKPNGSTGYGDTGYNPSTQHPSINCVQFAYSRETADGHSGVGMNAGQPWLQLLTYSTSGGIIATRSGGYSTQANVTSAIDGLGLIVGNRVSSTDNKLYKGGVEIASTTTAEANPMPNGNIWLGGMNVLDAADVFGSAQWALYGFGDAFTVPEITALETLVESFQDALSRGVQ
jgi:hypothetical protein